MTGCGGYHSINGCPVLARDHADDAGCINGHALVRECLEALHINTGLNRCGESVKYDVSLTVFERLKQQFSRRCCLGRTESVLVSCSTAAGLINPMGADRVMARRAADSFKAQTIS